MFNIQYGAQPEEMERLALCRELEARMVTVESRFGKDESFSWLARADWYTRDLEQAIDKLKGWIKEVTLPMDATDG
jgi:hypothetical protein